MVTALRIHSFISCMQEWEQMHGKDAGQVDLD